MKSKDTIASETLLQEHGYRVTSKRVALLIFLKKNMKPLSVGDIHKGMSHVMDKVTLYRALEDFVISKIVGKVNLQDASTYYEFLHHGHHHHHIVCEKCGKIEDIESCNQAHLEKEILKSSKSFRVINSHALEFFGICKACSS